MSDLKLGDIVVLKSGSSPMTVIKTAHTDTVVGLTGMLCAWSGDDGEMRSYLFPADALRIDERPDKQRDFVRAVRKLDASPESK